MTFGQPRVGVGVVVRAGGRVLVGRRRGSHGAGEWSLPGGRIDPGEPAHVTAERELREETGLAAPQLRPLGFWTTSLYPVEAQHWVTLFYTCEWDGRDPQLLEPHKCDGWQWHAWQRIPKPYFGGLADLQRQFPDLSSLPSVVPFVG